MVDIWDLIGITEDEDDIHPAFKKLKNRE